MNRRECLAFLACLPIVGQTKLDDNIIGSAIDIPINVIKQSRWDIVAKSIDELEECCHSKVQRSEYERLCVDLNSKDYKRSFARRLVLEQIRLDANKLKENWVKIIFLSTGKITVMFGD